MDNVVDITKNTPHMHGTGKCLSCKHEWVAVIPIGTVWMECPACGLQMGRLMQSVHRDGMHWHCICGNDLFKIRPDVIYCACCGVIYNEK